MRYVAIYLNCGEEMPSKIKFTCKGNRVLTKLYLIKYEGVDENASWQDLKENLKELKEEIASQLGQELSAITNKKIEQYCQNYVDHDEDVLLALINLKTGEDIKDYF